MQQPPQDSWQPSQHTSPPQNLWQQPAPYSGWPSQPPGTITPPQPSPQKPRKKRRIWLYLLAAFVVLCLCSIVINATSGGHSDASQGMAVPTATPEPTNTPAPTDTPQPTDIPTPAPSVAYQLASIDTGGSIQPDDPAVAKYQTLLDSLHNKTGDSEQAIADETVKGQQLLHEKGKDVKLLDLLQGVDTAIPAGQHMKYAEALAALITLLEQQ